MSDLVRRIFFDCGEDGFGSGVLVDCGMGSGIFSSLKSLGLRSPDPSDSVRVNKRDMVRFLGAPGTFGDDGGAGGGDGDCVGDGFGGSDPNIFLGMLTLLRCL